MNKLILFLIVSISLFSCSVHKNISSVKKTEDSTAVVMKDTSFKSTQLQHTDDFSAKGVDITVNYDNKTGAPDVTSNAKSSDKDSEARKLASEALTNLPSTGEIPKSITIHIDSLTNLDNTQVKMDSIGVKQQTVTNVKSTVDTKIKVVSKKSISFGSSILIGAGLLIVIVFFVMRFLAKKGIKFTV